MESPSRVSPAHALHSRLTALRANPAFPGDATRQRARRASGSDSAPGAIAEQPQR